MEQDAIGENEFSLHDDEPVFACGFPHAPAKQVAEGAAKDSPQQNSTEQER